MAAEIDNFLRDMDRLDASRSLHKFLIEQKIALDFDDILRWQWVWAVSAFDKFMHELIRTEMLASFRGERTPTKAFENFTVNLRVVLSVIQTSPNPQPWEIDELFREEIIRQHSQIAFQHPDKVASGLSLIWAEEHKWQVIGSKLSDPDTKSRLINIVTRRNSIVHESDANATNDGKNSISPDETEEVIQFLMKLAQAIHDLVHDKIPAVPVDSSTPTPP